MNSQNEVRQQYSFDLPARSIFHPSASGLPEILVKSARKSGEGDDQLFNFDLISQSNARSGQIKDRNYLMLTLKKSQSQKQRNNLNKSLREPPSILYRISHEKQQCPLAKTTNQELTYKKANAHEQKPTHNIYEEYAKENEKNSYNLEQTQANKMVEKIMPSGITLSKIQREQQKNSSKYLTRKKSISQHFENKQQRKENAIRFAKINLVLSQRGLLGDNIQVQRQLQVKQLSKSFSKENNRSELKKSFQQFNNHQQLIILNFNPEAQIEIKKQTLSFQAVIKYYKQDFIVQSSESPIQQRQIHQKSSSFFSQCLSCCFRGNKEKPQINQSNYLAKRFFAISRLHYLGSEELSCPLLKEIYSKLGEKEFNKNKKYLNQIGFNDTEFMSDLDSTGVLSLVQWAQFIQNNQILEQQCLIWTKNKNLSLAWIHIKLTEIFLQMLSEGKIGLLSWQQAQKGYNCLATSMLLRIMKEYKIGDAFKTFFDQQSSKIKKEYAILLNQYQLQLNKTKK